MRGLCPCIRLKRPVDPSAIRPNRTSAAATIGRRRTGVSAASSS